MSLEVLDDAMIGKARRICDILNDSKNRLLLLIGDDRQITDYLYGNEALTNFLITETFYNTYNKIDEIHLSYREFSNVVIGLIDGVWRVVEE